MAEAIQTIAQFLLQKHRFVLASHNRPDGDAIGSCLALALALRAAGKQVDVLGADSTPHIYRHLPGASTILLCKTVESGYDAAVIMECNAVERTGIDGLEKNFLINIDHHTSARPYAGLNWIDFSFGACGQQVFRLIEAMGLPVTPEIATTIYTALITDTGSFQFSNTTAVELDDARRLVELGVEPALVADQVYRSESSAKIRLTAAVLSTLKMDESERIGWVSMSPAMLQAAGAVPADTEGIVNQVMSIEKVQVAAFFKQEEERRCRVSLRSKGSIDVARVAETYQGGGHRNAAGFTVPGDLADAEARVIKSLEDMLLLHSLPSPKTT